MFLSGGAERAEQLIVRDALIALVAHVLLCGDRAIGEPVNGGEDSLRAVETGVETGVVGVRESDDIASRFCSARYTGMPLAKYRGERMVTSECSKSGCALKRCGSRRRITASNYSLCDAGMLLPHFGRAEVVVVDGVKSGGPRRASKT